MARWVRCRDGSRRRTTAGPAGLALDRGRMGAAMWESDLSPHGVTLTFGAVSARIALEGSVDVATGVALVDAATSAVSRFRFLDLDLAAVTSIDGPGVRSLIKIKRFADAYGAIVSVVEASPIGKRSWRRDSTPTSGGPARTVPCPAGRSRRARVGESSDFVTPDVWGRRRVGIRSTARVSPSPSRTAREAPRCEQRGALSFSRPLGVTQRRAGSSSTGSASEK